MSVEAVLAQRPEGFQRVARLRFEAVWAAAGHPNGVFCLTPAELVALTGAPAADIAADAPAAKPLARLAKPLAVAAKPLAMAAGS